MANSYLNIITFLLTTVFYYMAIKPSLTYDVLNDNVKYKEYVSNSYLYLAIYLLLVMVIQFVVNASIIATTCGGSISENMGAAGVFTFIPWTLIFGIIVIVLIIYPGFKSAFSDVIGYYYVSSSANTLLTNLLVNTDLEKKISDGSPSAPPISEMTSPSAPPISEMPVVAVSQSDTPVIGGAKSDKEQMQEAADLIIKICGNTSILINQIVPSNFNSYWSLLTPLKKDKYKNDSSAETTKLREDLFNLVVTRDNIGEAMWYIYTGLLLTSIVQLKITSRGCSSNPKTMQQNYQKFLDKEDEAKAKQEQATSTTYTITN
jgi:hypothetical protein